MTGFGAVIILAGVIIMLAGLAQTSQNKTFENAEVVNGKVTDKRKRDLKNGTAYELTVNYTVNGNEYSKVIGVKLSEYKTISEGDGFELKYCPEKPYKAIKPDALDPKKAKTVLIFGVVMVGVGIVLSLIGLLS